MIRHSADPRRDQPTCAVCHESVKSIARLTTHDGKAWATTGPAGPHPDHLREHRHEWADWLENWDGSVTPERPTVQAVINWLRADRLPFGKAATPSNVYVVPRDPEGTTP